MNQTQIYMAIGLTVFLIVMLALGFIGYKKTTTMADFAIAGSKMGPVVLGLAFAATFFSAATFVGYTGWAYGWGLSSLWVFLTLILASPMGLIVVAKRVRKINSKQQSLSLPDWLGDRYGSDFVRVVVALATLFNLFYIAAQLSAGALIFQQLMGVPYKVGLVVIAVIVVGYTFGGGSFADIYTDAFQAVLMAVVGLLVFASGFWVFNGGFGDVMDTVSSSLAEQGPEYVATVNPDSGIFYSIPAIIGAFIIQFAFASQPQLFNKVLALKSPRDMATMIGVYVAAAVAFLAVIFGGLYAAAEVPGLDNPDSAIFEYVQVAFPTIVVALFGVTVLAAAMSTSDGIFVVISTSIANDIYRKLLVKRGYVRTPAAKADRTALKISRWTTLLTGVIATLLVLNPPEFIGTFIWIGISGVASATLGPIIVGLFFPRLASAAAAKISVVAGIASYLVIHMTDFEESTLAAGAWAVCIGVASMFLASLAFPNPDGQLPAGHGPAETSTREAE
jgi:sodium/pantothenate symporter